jgi:dipeptidyl aminopeptidase/acylaminoacyl peptidase
MSPNDPETSRRQPAIRAVLLSLTALVAAVQIAACSGSLPPMLGGPTATPTATSTGTPTSTPTASPTITPSPTMPPHPLSIASMRDASYPGGDLTVEEELAAGRNYRRTVVSYPSEGLKIYALLTIPSGEKPPTGWPVVVFNHGYIPPTQYRTTERYVAYVDAFARNGYIVLKSDYRGHGSSEGAASGGYGSPGYTIDVLNALASIRRHPDADPNRVGMWGHSMGGHITLRSMVITDSIQAGVIWAGVVASYPDLFSRWRRSPADTPSAAPTPNARSWRGDLVTRYGSPENNPAFWDSISANAFLTDLSGPVQLHHGTADSSVPLEFSQILDQQIDAVEGEVELYVYDGDDHNLSKNLSTALARSVEFFDAHVKNAVVVEVAPEP